MLLVSVIFYLIITLFIGALSSFFVKNSTDYVLAGRRLPLYLSSSALFATWFGSETILGASSQFVHKGILGIIEEPLGAALCLFLVGVFFARKFYRMKILTIVDFFKEKYGRTVELITALCIIPSYFGWVAAQFVALGILLQSLTEMPLLASIWLGACLVILYTILGGMWAISITDFFQSIIILVGLSFLTNSLLQTAGGYSVVFSKTPDNFFRAYPSFDTKSIVIYLVAWATVGLGSIPQQDVFQRVMSANSERNAVLGAYIAGVFYLSIAALPLVSALCAVQIYPDLLQTDTQQILPLVVLKHSPLILQVFFFGALLSAIMSTASGALLAPSTVLGENILKPLFKDMDEKKHLVLHRFSVVLISIVSLWIASIKTDIYTLVGESSALSMVSLFIPLVAGLYWKKASRIGTIASMVLGLTSWVICNFSTMEYPPPLLVGFVTSLLSMLVFSLLFPDKYDL
jgi:solute:Na+ symporter, SSS family